VKLLFLKHPFWSFYVLAVSIFSGLIAYMVILEVIGQSTYGVEYSLLGTFRELQATMRAEYPVLFHHKDSWVFYLSCYVLMPVALPFIFLPMAPTVAAVTVVWVTRGSSVLRGLFKLYLPVQGRIGFRRGALVYIGLLTGIIAMVVSALLAEWFFGDRERVGGYLVHLGVVDAKTLLVAWIMGLLFNQGAVLEELGWRGYALPLLVNRLGDPLVASVVLGLLWGLWHFPREVPGLLQGTQGMADMLVSQMWFLSSCIGMSIVATWFVNLAGGSVLPAIIIHGAFNHVGGMFSSTTEGMRSALQGESSIMWLAAGSVVLLLAGRDLAWSSRRMVHGNADPSDAWTDVPPRL
jgi:membrane protease YdiL (CAAX protease family)